MTMRVEADDRMWLELPRTFPTDEGESRLQWADAVVERMRGRWGASLDDQAELAVRSALDHGLERVLPDDSLTLQWWPTASLANVVVHLVYSAWGEADGDERRRPPLVDDDDYVTAPVSALVTAPELGEGIESRYLVRVAGQDSLVLGGVNHLFESGERYVFVGAEATVPALVGILLDPLRRLVNGISILDDDGRGPWIPSTVDRDQLGRGEEWDLEAAVALARATEPDPAFPADAAR